MHRGSVLAVENKSFTITLNQEENVEKDMV